MNPNSFVANLSLVSLPNVFNPYSDSCSIHDLENAPEIRRKNLISYLSTVESMDINTIWMGRDLGHRGGRRTGIAFTDDFHINHFNSRFPGSSLIKATRGTLVKERTATEIWGLLAQISEPPLLWNVFPFHPHREECSFSNRKFNAKELAVVNDINLELFNWLGITKVIAIGQDAEKYATRLCNNIMAVRHPSYGGISDFRRKIRAIYGLS